MEFLAAEPARRILSDLISIPSANPMGREWNGTEPVERRANDYIAQLFAPYGASVARQDLGPMHESLVVQVPGASEGACLLFESHVDTVPVDEWPQRAFVPRLADGQLYGRGACDDKGSLAAMLLAMLDLLEHGRTPPAPVMLLAAGDEEYAQRGIKHFRDCKIAVLAAIFGEPTRSMPIVQHKGTIRWDITVHGKSAHTSRPELGVNAILGATDLIQALSAYQEALRARHQNPLMTGPAITVSMIRGGRTRNAVPDECTVAVDFRVTPGMQPLGARDELIAHVASLGLEMSHSEPQIVTPPLDTPMDHPFSRHVLEVCRRHAGPGAALQGEPYGTDAAWMADRAPTLVLGPGDIAHAHTVDEHVSLEEVVVCARIYRDIMMSWPG